MFLLYFFTRSLSPLAIYRIALQRQEAAARGSKTARGGTSTDTGRRAFKYEYLQ